MQHAHQRPSAISVPPRPSNEEIRDGRGPPTPDVSKQRRRSVVSTQRLATRPSFIAFRRNRTALLFIALLVVVANYALNMLYGASQKADVCVIGNSETVERGEATIAQWGNAFPAAFYVWGNASAAARLKSTPRLSFIFDPPSLSFAEGLDLARRAVMSQHSCGYIFTHDDDLVFRIEGRFDEGGAKDAPLKKGKKMAKKLVELLEKYKPAIASFPWAVGDERWTTMQQLKDEWQGQEVAPLTGFDNGMVLYHRDVIDFYFPFPPSGEGGFVGKWTLSAHFFMMFGGALFRENAMRINAIAYDNSINLNNQQINAEDVTVDDGKATVPWTRHPYEWPLNEAYISFLMSGLKDRQQPWGHFFDLDSAIPPAPFHGLSYSPDFVLARLSTFYDVRHEALSNNVFMKQFPASTLEELAVQDFNFRVIVFTMNRLDSFKRLWASIRSARQISHSVEIDVFIDWDEAALQQDRDAFRREVEKVVMGYGRTHFATEKKGLKKTYLTAWEAAHNNEFAIMLEDDIEVSPLYLKYAEAMVRAYVYRDHADHRLFAISLYAPRYNEMLDEYTSVDNGYNPYIQPVPSSWGAIFLPEAWRQFRMWQSEQEKYGHEPLLPNSDTNRWNSRLSWKKWAIRWMLAKNMFVIYPNLPDDLSFSTNHVEPGANHLVGAARQSDIDLIEAKYLVPLLTSEFDLSKGHELYPTPHLADLHVYSLHQERKAHLSQLHVAPRDLASFDQCTLVLSVTHHPERVEELLEHFTRIRAVGEVVLAWSNEDVKPPTEEDLEDIRVPVKVKMEDRATPHHRFKPFEEVQYDCVLSMTDEATIIPSQAVVFAIEVWRGSLFRRLIGFRHYARNHVSVLLDKNETVTDNEDGTLPPNTTTLYSPTPFHEDNLWAKKPFASILLTPIVVVHRDYLKQYWSDELAGARDVVTQSPGCVDLLLNFIVANASNAAPVVINTGNARLNALPDSDLSSLPTTGSKSSCLAAFQREFGDRMPFQYATTFFDPTEDTHSFVPGRLHTRSQWHVPTPHACKRDAFELTGDCELSTDRWLYRDQVPIPAFV